MKYLILGASGMAGHMIALYLMEEGHNVTGFCRNKLPHFCCIEGDASDRDLIRKIITQGKYDAVVNAIGILNNSAESHKAEAIYLNSFLPHDLALIAKDLETQIIQISTDCVFRGNTGPYDENSIPDGYSWYDRTKALGELSDAKNLTLRQSIVGPDLKCKGIGLLNWFINQEDTKISGYMNSIWTGLTTLELAKGIEACSKSKIVGLVNLVPNASISKYELLVLFNKYFKNGNITIEPTANDYLDKTLINSRKDIPFHPKDYSLQIAELRDWVSSHPGLYPNSYYRYIS